MAGTAPGPSTAPVPSTAPLSGTAAALRPGLLEVRDEGCREILSPAALDFVRTLHDRHAGARAELLAARCERRAQLAAGAELGFLPETAAIRQDPTWRVAPPAPGLRDRRVEITGPPDRKMTINALNSGARVWLADFEDALSPTWANVIAGQRNLLDAVRRQIDFVDEAGREYALAEQLATIVVRPRGLHLVDKHVFINGAPISASVLDFGLYLFHCARLQLDAGLGPYFYLPKLEHHLEARWWNDVFIDAQELLGLARGTIRATTLIETIPAAFQMEEILYELREHSAGLNAGRWDYIFSIIKNLGDRAEFVLPDRSDITMTVPFMRAYTQLLVNTCHRRGAHAIGGMSAFIPSRDATANANAFAAVEVDKEREAGDGFDGSWVAHPGLVPVCRDAFDAVLGEAANQVGRVPDAEVTAKDLLAVDATPGAITSGGLVKNIVVTLRYLDAWLGGTGAAAIDNLMEDAATAEISRSQLSQWLRHGVSLDDGTVVTPELVQSMLSEQFAAIRSQLSDQHADTALGILAELLFTEPSPNFFTVRAYSRHLLSDRINPG